MQTAVQKRTRAVLTTLAGLLVAAVLVAAIVVAALHFLPQQFATHHYQSYTLEVYPSAPWRPGQSLMLRWVPTTAEMSPNDPSGSVKCHFWLFGPYATQDAATAHVNELVPNGRGSDGYALNGATPVAVAPPLELSTDRGAAAPEPVAFVLPGTLAPGYYVAVSFVYNASTAWVAEVVAS